MSHRPTTILLVEDEPNIARGIRENLEAEGYAVETVANGREALDQIRRTMFDLVILDVMLPGMDGFTVCETARREGIDTPVLFLTARGAGGDRIRGLEVGGDDYLPKPFQLRELLLRVAAILRRRVTPATNAGHEPIVRFGGNEFDYNTFRGRSWDGSEQMLTQKEAMILKVLFERQGEVVWREDILEQVWDDQVLPTSRTIDNFIVRLRRRFEPDPDRPRFFHTVRGVGYKFTAAGSEEA